MKIHIKSISIKNIPGCKGGINVNQIEEGAYRVAKLFSCFVKSDPRNFGEVIYYDSRDNPNKIMVPVIKYFGEDGKSYDHVVSDLDKFMRKGYHQLTISDKGNSRTLQQVIKVPGEEPFYMINLCLTYRFRDWKYPFREDEIITGRVGIHFIDLVELREELYPEINGEDIEKWYLYKISPLIRMPPYSSQVIEGIGTFYGQNIHDIPIVNPVENTQDIHSLEEVYNVKFYDLKVELT